MEPERINDPQEEISLDAAGNVLRGKGGDTTTKRKGGIRGGVFEALPIDENDPLLRQPGAPQKSVEGWVLFVANLSPNVREDDLRDLFNECGAVRGVRVECSTRDCVCAGHALVQYSTYESALQASQKLHGQEFMGQPISVSFAFVVPQPAADDMGPASEEGSVKRQRGQEGASTAADVGPAQPPHE